jgi:negative regulator of flagellin synthesis FlgM
LKVPGELSVSNGINGVDIKPVRVASGTAVHKKLEHAAGEAGSGAVPEKDVHITGAARELAALAQDLKNLPAVDEARVAAVRQRLDDGSYKVDPQRVADRLLHLERQLNDGNLLK